MSSSRPLAIEMPIKVQVYDIDMAGIVSNISYVRWLEDLRLKFLDVHYPLQKLLEEGSIPIIKMTQIKYIRPIRPFDQVVGHGWMSEFGVSDWTSECEIISNGKIAAVAVQSGVFVDIASGRPTTSPEELLMMWEREKAGRDTI